MQSLGIPQLFGSAVQRLAGERQAAARSGDSNDERIAELFRFHGGASSTRASSRASPKAHQYETEVDPDF